MNIKQKIISVQSTPVLLSALAATLLLFFTLPIRGEVVEHQLRTGKYIIAYFEFPGTSPDSTVVILLLGNFDVSRQLDGNAQAQSRVEVFYIMNDIFANGSAEGPGSSTFHIQPSLNDASIDTSLVIKDGQTPTSFTVVVDAEFKGVGDPFRDRNVRRDVIPHFIFIERTSGSSRTATASGIIAIGETIYDLSHASFSDISFGTINNGYIVIRRE